MMLFQLSYERFLEEIRNEKVQPGDKNQLECEDLGNLVAYYLFSLDRPIAFVFVIKKDDMTDVQKFELSPISKQSMLIRESVQLTTISDALEKIEQNLKITPQTKKTQEQIQSITNTNLDASLDMNLVKNPNKLIE